MEQPTRHDYSAGGVAYRVTDQDPPQVQIALIATKGHRRWQLPKGTIEVGETPLAAAIREVAEETGVHTEHETFLQSITYTYYDTYRKDPPIQVHKQVDFFLLRIVGGELNDASHEVDGVGWFSPDEALDTLTFEGEQAVLRQAMEHWT